MNQNRESKVITAVKFGQAVEKGNIKPVTVAKTTLTYAIALFKQITDSLQNDNCSLLATGHNLLTLTTHSSIN